MRHIFEAVPILDADFDENDGLVNEIVGNILQRGVVDLHPNAWGVHDGLGVFSDRVIANTLDEEQIYLRSKTRQEARKKQLMEEQAVLENEERNKNRDLEEFRAKVMAFPHATTQIAWETAANFICMGKDDALTRGITNDEWLWKRSRFLAGFK